MARYALSHEWPNFKPLTLGYLLIPVDRFDCKQLLSCLFGKKPYPSSVDFDGRLRIGKFLYDLSVSEMKNVYAPSPLG